MWWVLSSSIRIRLVAPLSKLKLLQHHTHHYLFSRELQIVHNTTKFDVIGELNKLKTQPRIAISYFDRIQEEGFRPDVTTYLVFIRMLCYWRLDRKLHYLLLDLLRMNKDGDLGFQVSDLVEAVIHELNLPNPSNSLFRALDAFVKVYATLDMFEEASSFLFQTRRGGIVPHIFSCNFLMNRLIERGKCDMAVAIYRHLNKRLGVTPNDYTYGIVIKALCRKGNLKEAYSVFEEMKESGVLINLFTYTAMICGFCEGEKLEAAESVLRDMEKSGVVPDQYICKWLICSYCKTERADYFSKALSLHGYMVSVGIKTNSIIVSSLLQGFCKKGLASETLDWFHYFKNLDVFFDEVCYNIVMDTLCKAGRLEEAVNLLNDMKSKHMILDKVHYTTLIRGYCLNGKLGDALGVFKELNEEGIKPDKITFDVLVGGISRNDHKHKEIKDCLDYMREQGFEPDSITYNIVIEGLCNGGKVEEARSFFNNLKVKSSDNYCAMINGYCAADYTSEAYKNSETDYTSEAYKLFIMMFSLGLEPSEILYSKLIDMFCRVRDMGKARSVFDLSIRKGLTPDIITYVQIMNGYYREDCLTKASDLFDDMKKRGIRPDAKCYTELIVRQCTGDKLDDAVRLIDEMIERGLEPNNVVNKALIAACFRRTDVDCALNFVKETSCHLKKHFELTAPFLK